MIYTVEQRVLAGSQFDGANGGAVGSVTTVAGAALTAGESFWLNDGLTSVLYTFVLSADGFAKTNTSRPVAFAAPDTADAVRDHIVRAVNSTPSFDLRAFGSAAATVALVNRIPGHHGNVTPMADTVAPAGFVVSSMSGGVSMPDFEDRDGIRIYHGSTFGGLLDIPCVLPVHSDGVRHMAVQSWEAERILLNVTGATSYTLSLEQADGTSVALSTGAGAVVLLTNVAKIVSDERLKLVTVGGVNEMFARVSGRPLVMT